MTIDFDKILQKGSVMVDAVQQGAKDLAHKGKKQLDLAAAQNQLSKAQRQLGALVYSLARNGEENKPLVNKYIEAIASIEEEIDALRTQEGDSSEEFAPADYEEAAEEPAQTAAVRFCPQCGTQVSQDALFCNGCGAQL